jgi:hypothetical protein
MLMFKLNYFPRGFNNIYQVRVFRALLPKRLVILKDVLCYLVISKVCFVTCLVLLPMQGKAKST